MSIERVRARGAVAHRIPLGATSDVLVHHADLLPTIAELTGADLPAVELDGVSLTPVLHHPAVPLHDALANTMIEVDGTVTSAARSAAYKLIREPDAESLFRIAPSRFEVGGNLLAEGLGPEEAAEYERLAGLLDGLEAVR